MKRPESPCLDCQYRHENCHAEGECGNTTYTYTEYCKEMELYRQTVKDARMQQYLGNITDSRRFDRKKRKKG